MVGDFCGGALDRYNVKVITDQCWYIVRIFKATPRCAIENTWMLQIPMESEVIYARKQDSILGVLLDIHLENYTLLPTSYWL